MTSAGETSSASAMDFRAGAEEFSDPSSAPLWENDSDASSKTPPLENAPLELPTSPKLELPASPLGLESPSPRAMGSYDVDEGHKAHAGGQRHRRQQQQQRQRQRQPEKEAWMAPKTHAMKLEHAQAAKMAAARRRTRPWNMSLDPNMPEHAHGSLTPRATDYWLVAARRRIMLMDMPVAEQAHIARLKLSRKLAAYGDGTLARAWGCAPEPGTRCRKASQRRRQNDKNDTPGVSGRFAPGS